MEVITVVIWVVCVLLAYSTLQSCFIIAHMFLSVRLLTYLHDLKSSQRVCK